MWKFIFNMREILLNELVTQENIGISQKIMNRIDADRNRDDLQV